MYSSTIKLRRIRCPTITTTTVMEMASSTPTPHLLTIPREIRNQIYSYLHRDLELRTVERMGVSQVFVSLTKVPYVNVFRVHPRLHAEYLESGPINNLSALVSNVDYWGCDWSWSKDAEAVTRDNTALKNVKSITLRFCPHPEMEEADCVDLINALTAKAPALVTIRIEERAVLRHCQNEPLSDNLDSIADDKIPSLPNAFASLPLVQRANCRRITTKLVSEKDLTTGQRTTAEHHGVIQYRTHLYSIHRSARDLWTAHDILEYKHPRSYTDWILKSYKENDIKMRCKSERVCGWEEESCGESRDGSCN